VASGSVAALAAGACFLLAALAHSRGSRYWQIGTWLGASGAVILAGALVGRGLRASHWPLSSQYEFTLAFALGTALAALLLGAKARHRSIQTATLVVATVLIVYASQGVPTFNRVIQPLPPVLDSVWLPLHVGSAALSYGALTLAGVAGFVWLVHGSNQATAEWMLDRAIAIGYPLLTLSMLLGMVWAQVAWGRYWGWDLKEVWTLIMWLVYTLYWHLRGRPRWKGGRLAWLALAGLGVVLFTFLGVGWLARTVSLGSLHLF
jgi:ABC-type transport system involved in cytochrome c biogenesis permease subunit